MGIGRFAGDRPSRRSACSLAATSSYTASCHSPRCPRIWQEPYYSDITRCGERDKKTSCCIEGEGKCTSALLRRASNSFILFNFRPPGICPRIAPKYSNWTRAFFLWPPLPAGPCYCYCWLVWLWARRPAKWCAGSAMLLATKLICSL